MKQHQCWPSWVSGAIGLAVAVNLVAAILVIALVLPQYPRVQMPTNGEVNLRVPSNGLWFCVNGTFGNGCWAP